MFCKTTIQSTTIFIFIFLLSGCDSKKIVDGVEYTDSDIFSTVNKSNFIGNISLIRDNICQVKVIPPLSPIYQNDLNQILISKDKKIQALYPDYRPSDEAAGETAGENIAEGGKIGGTVISAILAAGFQSYQNEKVFADPNVKNILLEADQQIKSLYNQYTHGYIDPCLIKVLEFEDGGWDEHWGVTKFMGAYEGKYREIKITLNLSNKLIVNLELIQYDNGKFEYTIKSAKDIE